MTVAQVHDKSKIVFFLFLLFYLLRTIHTRMLQMACSCHATVCLFCGRISGSGDNLELTAHLPRISAQLNVMLSLMYLDIVKIYTMLNIISRWKNICQTRTDIIPSVLQKMYSVLLENPTLNIPTIPRESVSVQCKMVGCASVPALMC